MGYIVLEGIAADVATIDDELIDKNTIDTRVGGGMVRKREITCSADEYVRGGRTRLHIRTAVVVGTGCRTAIEFQTSGDTCATQESTVNRPRRVCTFVCV